MTDQDTTNLAEAENQILGKLARVLYYHGKTPGFAGGPFKFDISGIG